MLKNHGEIIQKLAVLIFKTIANHNVQIIEEFLAGPKSLMLGESTQRATAKFQKMLEKASSSFHLQRKLKNWAHARTVQKTTATTNE